MCDSLNDTDSQPEEMEPGKNVDVNFNKPEKLNSKRKSSCVPTEDQILKIKITPKHLLEKTIANKDLQNELQSSKVPATEKCTDSDEDCLSILCTCSMFSEDFSCKSNIIEKNPKKETRIITYCSSSSGTVLESNKGCRLDITEPIPPSQELHASIESRFKINGNKRSINLRTILALCNKLECRAQNLHEILDIHGNFNENKAEELKNSFIDHLPFFITMIFEETKYKQILDILTEQLLIALKASLKRDLCHAVSILLHTACTVFSNNFKVIHIILRRCIKQSKYIKNILEAARPLLSLPRFHWPLWLQKKTVCDLIENNIPLSEQDYKALFQVLPSDLFSQLPRPRNTLNLISARKRLQLKESKQSKCVSPSHGVMNSQVIFEFPMKCKAVSPVREFPIPISQSSSSPTFSQFNHISQNVPLPANNNDNKVDMSKYIIHLVVRNEVHSAIDILKTFDVEEFFEVAHDIYLKHSEEYINVVFALMSYLKNRSFMYLLDKKLNIYMSTLCFNLLVTLIKNVSLDEALNFFYDMKQSGFDYLHAQLFPELMGEKTCQSQMKTVLIVVDLLKNTDNFDQAVQIFIDNDLLGDSSKWKLSGILESDIELRDRYISHIFSLLVEDNRTQMTMLACKLATEMQKQSSPFTSNADQMIRLLTKLLKRSSWNKLAYDIFSNLYSMADIGSKFSLAVCEPAISRAMLVISHSINRDDSVIMLDNFSEWDVYPSWKFEANTIIVHSNWLQVEYKMLIIKHLEELVSVATTFGSMRLKPLNVMVEEFASEEVIVILKKDDCSFDAAADEVREVLLSLKPPIRSVQNKNKLVALHDDWINYLKYCNSNRKADKSNKI